MEAYHETLTCPPEEATQRAAEFERLLNDVLNHRPATGRAALLEAIQTRYREFRRARRKPTMLPPKA